MQDKKFHAILCKNYIARQIATAKRDKTEVNLGELESCLIGIENYLDTGNQPSVEDIIEHNTQTDRKFSI
jgi:hypothetical protein